MNLPNLLSAIRIALVPLFLVLHFRGQATEALWTFVAAALTDIVDGLLARALHQETALGSWLDPLADKLLVFSAFIALTVADRAAFPPWFTALVLGRDLFVVAGIALLKLAGRRVEISPTRVSKYATFFQTMTLAGALAFRSAGLPPEALPYLHAVMFLCAVFAAASIAQYGWRGARLFAGRPA